MSLIVQTFFGAKNNYILDAKNFENVNELLYTISLKEGIPLNNISLIQDGKYMTKLQPILETKVIHALCGLPGGKGGFGSMLRAIGAQIEKTTNREACRDLSGRRLRDINEEQRLKKWLARKEELKKESEQKRIEKLKRICSEPKPKPLDEQFCKEMEENAEKVSKAVEEGLAIEKKRKAEELNKPVQAKKKMRFWNEYDESDDDTEDESGMSDKDGLNYNKMEHALKTAAVKE